MPTYQYSCEVHGEFEADHSVNEVLQTCPLCDKENKTSSQPKRLISKTSFVLQGSGWGKDNYGK